MNSDLEHISYWGSRNHAGFNALKTSILSISLKRHPFALHLCFDSTGLHFIDSISLVDLSITSSFYFPISRLSQLLVLCAKLDFYFVTEVYLLLPIFTYCTNLKSTSLEHRSHVSGEALSDYLSLLDQVQNKIFQLTNDPKLEANRRLVASLSHFLSLLLFQSLSQESLYFWSSSAYPILTILNILIKFSSRSVIYLSVFSQNWHSVEH